MGIGVGTGWDVRNIYKTFDSLRPCKAVKTTLFMGGRWWGWWGGTDRQRTESEWINKLYKYKYANCLISCFGRRTNGGLSRAQVTDKRRGKAVYKRKCNYSFINTYKILFISEYFDLNIYTYKYPIFNFVYYILIT